jgi:hypothetical protein
MRPAAQETVRVEHVLWDKYEVIRNDFPTDWHWHKFFTSGFHHMHDLKRGSCAFYDYLEQRVSKRAALKAIRWVVLRDWIDDLVRTLRL